MNKQALAFLTLFSLILMLSVYYVTLPSDTTTVMNEEIQPQQEESEEPTQESEKENKAEHTSLQEEADKNKDDEINKASSIVSSADSSESQKQEALETIEDLKSAKAMQTEVATALSDEGYMAAVEIKDNTCNITIFEQEESKDTAKKIMKTVNAKIKNQYLIEVAFK